MEEKGFDLPAAAPKALHEIPNLDRAQVIVALDKGVRRAFPREPRKTVYLNWDVADPSRADGSPEAIKAAYERTWQFIQSHVKDLTDAISGSKKE
jgi:protein-tyrosine-phosphatase